MALRMNKLDVTFAILKTKPSEMDEIFREPIKKNGITKEYEEPITIPEIAQFRNNIDKKAFYGNADNNSIESKSRLVISVEDWEMLKVEYEIELKKGDLITEVASEKVKLIINEIKPTGYIGGKYTIIFVELADHNVPVGGVY